MSRSPVREAVREAAARFAAAGCLTPRLDAELLLAEVLEVRREALYREPERLLTADEARRFAGYTERRERREPVAYIIGRRAFRTIELTVGPGVLVPRPETETLVEVVLEKLARLDEQLDRELGLGEAGRPAAAGGPPAAAAPASGGPAWDVPATVPGRVTPRLPRLLDVGTGSGAVALAVAAEHPGVRVVATDIDPQALRTARLNAERLGLAGRVEFLEGDLFDGLPAAGRFDIIAANPPYLSEGELAAVQQEVRVYEPRHALVAGPSGLETYERLVPGALPHLAADGLLAVEIHEGRAEQIVSLFRKASGYGPTTVRADLGGAPRVVSARRRA